MVYDIYKIEIVNNTYYKSFITTTEAKNKKEAIKKQKCKSNNKLIAIKKEKNKRFHNIYAADFECNNSEDNGKVWAWGIEKIGDKKSFNYGNNINSFMEYIEKNLTNNKINNNKIIVYFHNLKYDVSRIILYLNNKGFLYNETKKDKTYTSLIDKTGAYYYLQYYKEINNKLYTIEFRDSYKKIPFKIKTIADSYGLKIKKGTLNYNEIRSNEHIITQDELEYLKNDVEILAEALKIQYENNLTHLTIGSDALAEFKKTVGETFIEKYLENLTEKEDLFIRKAYLGGYNFCISGVYNNGLSLDDNSHYPAQMHSKSKHLIPVGKPEYFIGKYKEDKSHPLYIQHIKALYYLKDNHLPTVRNANKLYNNEWSIDSEEEIVDLYLTNIDLELFLSHYEVLYIKYIEGYKFKGIMGIFDEYINKYMEMKINNNNNIAKRTIAKLMLNNLYGKFGTKEIRNQKEIIIDEGLITLKNKEELDLYKTISRVDIAAFITSYGRYELITKAQKFYKMGTLIYTDTDSIHIKGYDIKNIVEIDNIELGKWKIERKFNKGIFIKCKTYAEKEEGGEWILKCSGMTDDIKEELIKREDFEHIFKNGLNTKKLGIKGKLTPKMTKDGIILINNDYTIR